MSESQLSAATHDPVWEQRYHRRAFAGMLAIFLAAPFVGYPVFLMKMLCFGLFACAFNLLIGYTGLLSFGHAAFLGTAGYVTGHTLAVLGLPFEAGIVLGVLAAAVLGL